MSQSESAHILALPPEVASEIFLRCVPSFEEMRNEWRNPADCGPLLLVKVCRLWRDLVSSIPALFAILYVRVPEVAVVSIEEFNRGVVAWIGRSHHLPLTISIYIPHVSFASNTTAASFIVSHAAPRIRFLQLRMPMELYESLADNTITQSFPLLRELVLDVTNPADHASCVTFFRNAPQLQHVSQHVDYLGGRHSSFVLPWSQLTTFRGDLPDALEILGLAPQLLEATLVITPELDFQGRDLIHHAHLQVLIFPDEGSGMGETADGVLALLVLPSLQRLDIHGSDRIDLYPFLAQSSPPLQELSACLDPFSRDWEKAFCTGLHMLESLHIALVYPWWIGREHILLGWLMAHSVLHVPRLKKVVFRAKADHHEALVNSLLDWWRQQRLAGVDKLPIFQIGCELGSRAGDLPSAWLGIQYTEICG